MRILQVVGGLAEDWGGPSTVVRELARALAARRHEVEIRSTDVAPRGTRTTVPLDRVVAHPDGYSVRYYRVDRPTPPYPSVAMAWAMWREPTRWDVVHIHGLFSMPVSMTLLALRARRRMPYVVRTCGMLDRYSLEQRPRLKRIYFRALERHNLAAAARLHVSTPLEADAVRALDLGPPICVIPQGVDAPPPPTHPAPHRGYVLFLSRIARKKGLDLLVRAFASIAVERADLDLVIAGPDERGHQQEIAELVRSLALEGRVRFTGFVHGTKKGDLLAHAAAFALTSHDENFGVVVAEAVQAGTPVVVTDRLGLAPLVVEHDAGEVVSLDVEAITAALRTVLRRGKEGYRAGTASMARTFDWAVAAERVEEMYRAILAERPRR